MTLDVPIEVRNKALADGAEAWLDSLPGLVDALAQDWSLTIGAPLSGGHAALVIESTLDGGTEAVLKIAMPSTRRDLANEATALRVAEGDGIVRLLRADSTRDALLLERLGAPMAEVITDRTVQQDLLCDLAMRLWRPVGGDVDLPTGADRAGAHVESLPRLWEETGRPCSRAAIADAIACAERRRDAHDDGQAVLVHGDAHELNALLADDGGYKLIDPHGVRAEPACDLGTIMRNDPGGGHDLRARAERLAARAGVDATAIWEWGTVYRVGSGLYCRSTGNQPFGDRLLADAERLSAST